MTKQETLDEFIDACYSTIKCQMCGTERSDICEAEDIADAAYEKGWRFQKDMILCPFCTDDKR